jgi:LysM repeat protein
MWNDLSMKEKAAMMKVAIKNGITDLDSIRGEYNKFANGGTYTVKAGDSLWRIAKNNNLSLKQLVKYNPQLSKGEDTIIHPNDVLNLEDTREWQYRYRELSDVEREESNLNKNNLSAIQGTRHDSNYGVIDKKNRTLTIYDKDNNPVYTTDQINTGASHNDYNTITYTDDSGRIKNMEGNLSTPGGITIVSGAGTYHGYPSFTRARINQNKEANEIKDKDGNIFIDNIASSMHWGNIKPNAGSNGCTRVGGKQLCDLKQHIGEGTMIYTLPEQEGSRFVLREGKLSYVADNPYGISLNKAKDREDYKTEEAYQAAVALENKQKKEYQKKYGNNWEEKYNEDYKKRFWDDYNTFTDKTYSPLIITAKQNTDNYEHDGNAMSYANSIMLNKETLQNDFGVDSYTYDKLAQIAMGIGEQETKFGTSKRYNSKKYIPNFALDTAKNIKAAIKEKDLGQLKNKPARSRGLTQIKFLGDNEELREKYKNYGVNLDNITQAGTSGLATMIRLLHMYNTEVRGREFKDKNGNKIDPWDAVLYAWNGTKKRITSGKSNPKTNSYVKNVHKYIDNYDFDIGFKEEKKALGGNLFDLGGDENQSLGNIPIKDIPLGIWWLTGQNQAKPFAERQSIPDYLNKMEALAANRKRDKEAYKVNPEVGDILLQVPTRNLMAEREKIASKYSIPYKEENRLNLTKGRFNTGYTTTDVLDAIYNAAKNTGTDFSTALGLAARESGLGYARNFEKNGNITMTDLYSNWNQIHPILMGNKARADYGKLKAKYNDKIPLSDSEIKFMSEFVKKWNKEVDSIHDINENPIENALKYYSTGEYNKNKEHSKLVQKEGALLLTDPAIQKWAKQRGYTFAEGGFVSPEGEMVNPYSSSNLANSLWNIGHSEFLGEPSHGYKFAISEEEANKLGYFKDERGHYSDDIKYESHPTHPSRGTFKSLYQFDLSNKGILTPNYTIFGMADGNQDGQAMVTYKNGIVLPEITVTPKRNYILNDYDNYNIYFGK